MSRREYDAAAVIEALDHYIELRFGIRPRDLSYDRDYYEYERQAKAKAGLAKALIGATGNPEPE